MTDPGASPSRCAQDRPETTAPSEATAAGAREALLRQSEERQRFMLALGDALRRESHAEAKIEVAARLLGEHLAASRVLWAEYDWDAGLAHIFNGWFADGAQPFPSVIPLADYDGEILGELCAGRIVRVADVGARAAEPAYRAIAALGVQALLSPPLLVDGRLKVNLSVHQHAPRHWTDAEVALVREAAERLWAEVLIARAEAALRASEAKYRDLFETMGQGYFYNEVVRDAAGRPVDLRHLDLNPAFERLTGKLLAESKGRTSKEVFGGLDEEWLRSADEVVRSGTPRRVEHFLTPVGRWFEAHFYPAGGDRFTGFYEDIHERKLAEAVLRESEERQAFLLAHSDAVRMLGDAAEIQSATSRLIVEHMGVDRAMYAEVEGPRGAEQGIVRGQYITGRGDGPRAIVPFAERFAYAQFGKHRMRARYRGELLVVADIEADPAADAAERANWKAAGVRAAVVAPLVKGGRLVAEFGVQSTAPREWTEAELTLVRDVAERTWAAAERARAEAALPESEERYRTLFESMDEAYAVVEVLRDETGKWADFRFIDVNPAFLQHTAMPWPVGKTATELLGSPNPRWAELYGEALDRGEAVRVEEDEPTLGRTFDLNIFALDRDRDRVAVLFTNVTERKQAEAALRKSEERFRLIVENARDYAIFTTDPAGTVTDWREGAGAVFGYPPAEIVGASCDILFTPEDRAAGEPERERATAAAEGRAPDVRWHMRKDGSRVFIDGVSTALRGADGKLVGFLKIGQDVTERHAAEERQKLLLAELQHRVRNTLGMIRSMVRFTAEGHDDIEDYLSHLTGRLDSLSRIQQLLTRSPNAQVDLHELVSDEMTAQAGGRSAYRLDGPPVALAPKAAEVLSLALHELVTNSVKYGALGELGQTGAQVGVEWNVIPRGEQQWLELRWREPLRSAARGAPRRGFGTELITERVPYELRGEARLEIGKGQVIAEIAFPLASGPMSLLETRAPQRGAS